MQRIGKLTIYVCSALLSVVGCSGGTPGAPSEEVGATQLAAHGGTEIRPRDDCDPATFGALCNPNFHGETTLASFSAQLAAKKSVDDWEYSSTGHLSNSESLNVVSRGGETHTFTVVAQYGGGKVPGLNTASGNPVPAPECLAAASPTNVTVPSGSTQVVTSGATGALKPGHHLVQCCIHPWMRTVVDVQ